MLHAVRHLNHVCCRITLYLCVCMFPVMTGRSQATLRLADGTYNVNHLGYIYTSKNNANVLYMEIKSSQGPVHLSTGLNHPDNSLQENTSRLQASYFKTTRQTRQEHLQVHVIAGA